MDLINFRPDSAAGMVFLSSYRRSLVNRNGKPPYRFPSDYYVYGKSASVRPGSVVQTVLEGGQFRTIVGQFYNTDFGPQTVSSFIWSGHNQYNTSELSPQSHKDYGECRDVAMARLFSLVRDAKGSSFNAAVFSAEAGKSIEMIGAAANRLYRAYRDFRRGDIPDFFSTLAGSPSGRPPGFRPRRGARSANNWLEYKDGWMPLYQDIYNGAQKVASLVLNEDPILHVTAKAKSDLSSVVPYGSQSAGARRGTGVFTDSLRIRTGISYSMGSYAVTQASSLGLTNPASVAWELVPLSFVFDWALPVGDFLESLSTFDGLKFHSGYLSAKRNRSVDFNEGSRRLVTGFGQLPNGGYGETSVSTYSSASYSTRDWGFTRGRFYDFPRIPPPRFRRPESLQKAITALSLLRQRIR